MVNIAAVAAALALVTVVAALPDDSYHPQPKHAYKSAPKPYNFAYGVIDPYQGINFGQTEESDGNQVRGSYTVQLPDGRKQIVTYIADHKTGYHADVKYEGKAQYPPKSEHPPFIVRPKDIGYHAPEPSYHAPEPSYHEPAHIPTYHEPPHVPTYHEPPHAPTYH
uniref:Cuticle protein 18.6-like n=1 Tax=Hirondellea gigas TaxID=1518452 RepID=A0A2P2I4P9_9CRUS